MSRNDEVRVHAAPTTATYEVRGVVTLTLIPTPVPTPAPTPAPTPTPTPVPVIEPFFGMNVHPNQTSIAAYQRSPDDQAADMAGLGVHIVRADVYGTPDDLTLMQPYCDACAAKGIEVFLCFGYNSPPSVGSESDNYDAGYQWATTIATGMKDYVTCYEITNEMSTYCNGEGAGTDPGAYDLEKYNDCRGFTLGLVAGVKDAHPEAKLIMGGGVTTLTAYSEMLWNGTAPDGSSGHPTFKWDVIGWHWYESSGSITAAYDGTGEPYNVLENLQQYGTPIWMTELGFNAGGDDEDQQCAYVQQALAEYDGYRDTYAVQAVCWYVLYDLPAEGACYGLIAEDGISRKPAYSSFTGTTAAIVRTKVGRRRAG